MFEKYYTPEQLDYLEARRKLVGEARMKEVQREWTRLFDRFAELRARGDAADSAESLELARQARALIDEFTGGDTGIEDALRNMYRSEGAEKVLAQHDAEFDSGAWAQLSRSMRALEGHS